MAGVPFAAYSNTTPCNPASPHRSPRTRSSDKLFICLNILVLCVRTNQTEYYKYQVLILIVVLTAVVSKHDTRVSMIIFIILEGAAVTCDHQYMVEQSQRKADSSNSLTIRTSIARGWGAEDRRSIIDHINIFIAVWHPATYEYTRTSMIRNGLTYTAVWRQVFFL